MLLDGVNSNQNSVPILRVHFHLEQIILKTDLLHSVSQYLHIRKAISAIITTLYSNKVTFLKKLSLT